MGGMVCIKMAWCVYGWCDVYRGWSDGVTCVG